MILYLKTYANYYNNTDIGEIPYNLLHGLGYTYNGRPSAYFLPVYMYLWTAMMIIFGIFEGQFALQLLQAIALSVTPILLYRFLTYFSDKYIIALISSVWLSIYPELLVLSSFMYAESIMLFLLVLTFVVTIWWRESKTYLKGILLGAIISVLILTNARMSSFIGIFLLYLFIIDWKKKTNKIILHYLLPCIYAMILIGIWTTRNVIELKSLIITNSTIGFNLWAGHNIDANGTSKYYIGNSPITKIKIKSSEATENENAQMNFRMSAELDSAIRIANTEADVNKAYLKEAYKFIINNPGKELELSLKKFYYAWWRSPNHIVTGLPIYILPWCITLFFFIIGLIISFSHSKKYILFYLIFIFSTLFQIIFHVNPRYKVPVYPFVFGIAAMGFIYLIELIVSKNEHWEKKYTEFTIWLLR